MLSHSNYSIYWIKPNIEPELRHVNDGGEWEHEEKIPFYRRHNLTPDRIRKAFDSGVLVPYPRSSTNKQTVMDIAVEVSYHTFKDFEDWLKKPNYGAKGWTKKDLENYSESYWEMAEQLQALGTLTLPTPIILCCKDNGVDCALLFSGFHRQHLAWNHGIIPYVWMVTVR